MGLEITDTRIKGIAHVIVRITWTAVDGILADYKDDEFGTFERAQVFEWARAELPAWALAMTGEDFACDARGIYLVGPAMGEEGPGLASTRPAAPAAARVA